MKCTKRANAGSSSSSSCSLLQLQGTQVSQQSHVTLNEQPHCQLVHLNWLSVVLHRQ
jgi:hypothetical protein